MELFSTCQNYGKTGQNHFYPRFYSVLANFSRGEISLGYSWMWFAPPPSLSIDLLLQLLCNKHSSKKFWRIIFKSPGVHLKKDWEWEGRKRFNKVCREQNSLMWFVAWKIGGLLLFSCCSRPNCSCFTGLGGSAWVYSGLVMQALTY